MERKSRRKFRLRLEEEVFAVYIAPKSNLRLKQTDYHWGYKNNKNGNRH
jgi:hypothetical protein